MTPFRFLLADYRDRARLSQTALAERAGVERSTISRLERGSRRPTPALVGRLAMALGLSPEDADRLRASAGLLPHNALALADPLVADLAAILSDERLPAQVRDDLRQAVSCAIALAGCGRRAA